MQPFPRRDDENKADLWAIESVPFNIFLRFLSPHSLDSTVDPYSAVRRRPQCEDQRLNVGQKTLCPSDVVTSELEWRCCGRVLVQFGLRVDQPGIWRHVLRTVESVGLELVLPNQPRFTHDLIL